MTRSTAPPAAVEAHRVGARLGGRAVLRDIDLALPAGRWVAVVGPNGAGKTTLMKVLAGLLPHSGTVVWDGRPLADWPDRERALHRAWLGQAEAGADDLDAADVVMLGRLPHRGWLAAPSAADRAAVEQAMRATRCWDWRGRPLGRLSGGERQRVLLARALAVQAQVLLMDEPLSNLDALLRLEMRAELKRLLAELGATTIYVTHDQIEAMSMGDRIAVMRDGVIEQVDRPTTVYDFPANQFIGGFIGTPPMNFLNGQVQRSNGHNVVRIGEYNLTPNPAYQPLLAPYDGKPMVVGIRAENMETLASPADDALRGDRGQSRDRRTLLHRVQPPHSGGAHGHRAGHAIFTRNPKHGITMLVVAKLARLAGIDELHTGTWVGKMEGVKDELKK